MIQKTYVLTQFNKMNVVLTVNGQRFIAEFKGTMITPYHRKGWYCTSDPDVQAALEKHPQYPGEFIIEKEVEIPDPEVTEVVEETEVVPDTTDIPNGELPHNISENGTVEVGGITNSQKAKIYLNQNHGVAFSQMANVEEVRKQAKLHNIEFIDWK